MKKQSGITLIALVITIIVLLILAGVSITTLTGGGGIIENASETKENADFKSIREQINQALIAQDETYTETNKIYTLQDLGIDDAKYNNSLLVIDGEIVVTNDADESTIQSAKTNNIQTGVSAVTNYKIYGKTEDGKSLGEDGYITIKSIGKNLINFKECFGEHPYGENSTADYDSGEIFYKIDETNTNQTYTSLNQKIYIDYTKYYTFNYKFKTNKYIQRAYYGEEVFAYNASGTQLYNHMSSTTEIKNRGLNYYNDEKTYGNKTNTFLLKQDSNISYIKLNEYILGLGTFTSGDEITMYDIQLEEGEEVTDYEEYKEKEYKIELKEPLRSLDDGTADYIEYNEETNTSKIVRYIDSEGNKLETPTEENIELFPLVQYDGTDHISVWDNNFSNIKVEIIQN